MFFPLPPPRLRLQPVWTPEEWSEFTPLGGEGAEVVDLWKTLTSTNDRNGDDHKFDSFFGTKPFNIMVDFEIRPNFAKDLGEANPPGYKSQVITTCFSGQYLLVGGLKSCAHLLRMFTPIGYTDNIVMS